MKKKINVIWIASYPKSGNTWIHSVLRVAGRPYGFPESHMDVYEILRTRREPEVCDAVQDRFTQNPCVVLKTHAPYGKDVQFHEFETIETVNAARIYISRNPLDMLLSYINFSRLVYPHYRHDEGYKKDLFIEMLGFRHTLDCEEWLEIGLDAIPTRNLDHALDFFSAKGLVLGYLSPVSWSHNIVSWLAAGNDMPGYVVKYEDCIADPTNIARLAGLFKFSREEVLLALDDVNAKARSLSESGDKASEVFYNKMKAYYFKDYFSGEAIDRFFRSHESVMREVGYAGMLDMI